MGVIRGLLVVVGSVLLFLSLLSVTFFWVSSSSLNYENLQDSAPSVIMDFLEEVNVTSIIDSNYNLIQTYCNSSYANSNYVFKEGNYTFDIPCESVSQGRDTMVQEGVKNILYKIYYTEYNCNFFDCLKVSPFFLISERAYNYLDAKFYFFLFVSFILIIALFLFIEKKTNTFILTGSLMIISALIFVKIDSFFALFYDKIFFRILGIFFSQSFSVSVSLFITGIILLMIGFIFKIFRIGFKISGLISKLKTIEKTPSVKKGKRTKSK